VEFTFFQGLLSLEDLEAGRFCTLSYALTESKTSTTLPTAWVQWRVQTDVPSAAEGQCDTLGSWGSTPQAWLATQPVAVGLGPISEATLSHLESLWTHYEPAYGGPFAEITHTLVGGQLHLEGQPRPDWGFGLAVPTHATSPAQAIPAERLRQQDIPPLQVGIMGMRPHKIGDN